MTLVRIRYLNISAVSDDVFCVIENGAERPAEIVNTDVWKRRVLGKWLAVQLLKEHGVDDSEFFFHRYGKPYVRSAVSFNISHSNDVIVCASSSHGEVGIDIEYVRPLEWEHYQDSFSAQEWEQLQAADNPALTLLHNWTQKESLLKADGRGLQLPLTSVMINNNYGRIEHEDKTWHLRSIMVDQYVCCVCTEFPIQQLNIERCDLNT